MLTTEMVNEIEELIAEVKNKILTYKDADQVIVK